MRSKASKDEVGWPKDIPAMPSRPIGSQDAVARTRRRCKQGERATCDVLTMNSAGVPQFRAVLQTYDDEALLVLNQEMQSVGHTFVDLQYESKAVE